jgi:Flp pilus assembly protein TadD
MRRTRLTTRMVACLVSLALSLPAQDTAQNPAAIAAFRAGQEAFQKEDFDAAIAQFKAAVAADPRLAAAHCALGQAYMTTRRYQEAVDALVLCKSATERQAAAQAAARANQQREIDREMQEIRQSISALRSGQVKTVGTEQRILQLEERLRKLQDARAGGQAGGGMPPAIPFALGTAYLRVGSLDLAERELRDALRIKPDLGEAHVNLAAIYARTGRWDEAATHVRLAESAGFAVPPALKADVAARRAPPAPVAGAPADPPAPLVTAPGAAVATPMPVETAFAIDHEPVTCVASDSFPRVAARVSPPGSVSAKVFFRADDRGPWYAVRLRSEDDVYSAILPRPRSTPSFRYYIEATAEDTRTARTPEHVTKVVDRAEKCGAAKPSAVATATGIVVEPPPGAAENKPVPSGFSARGTVGEVGQFEMSTKVAVGAGLVLAGAAVAGAAAAAKKEPVSTATTIAPRPDLGGDITLLSTDPARGGTISFAGSVVSVTFRAVSPYAVPAGPVRVTFSNTRSFLNNCATLTGSHPGLSVNEPITVTVTGRVTPGFCGDRFDSPLLRILMQQSGGPQVLQTGTGFTPDIAVPFAFVP